MGVLFDCPELVARVPATLERDLDRNAYRVELSGERLAWVTREGVQQVRFATEPETSLCKRFHVGVLSLLPIEGLL